MNTLDISIRVSRQGSRADDRMYTTENQERECRERATQNGYGVGLVTQEINVSGGKAAAKREIGKLIKRVEDGVSAGIMVYDFSRFSREEPYEAISLVGRVHAAGGVILSVVDNFDSSSEMGAMHAAMLSHMAHSTIKTARERSGAGQRTAKENGKYIGKTPRGYDRENGELVVNETEAEIVREIFAGKLAGRSYAELTRLANTHGMKLSIGGIRRMLVNPVYIGRSDGGMSPTIIEVETFTRVQGMSSTRKAWGQGAQTLCQGIAYCANCGSTLIVTRPDLPTGTYYCRGHKIDGCDKRGCISITKLDEYVNAYVKSEVREDGLLFKLYNDQEAVKETARLRDEAAFELSEMQKSTSLITSLGIERFEQMIAAAAAKLEIAESAYAEAMANTDVADAFSLFEAWDSLPLDVKRRFIPKVIERVQVLSGRGLSVERKTQIVLRGGILGTPDSASLSLV